MCVIIKNGRLDGNAVLTANKEIVMTEEALEHLHLMDAIQELALKLVEERKKILDQLKPEIFECILLICERIIRAQLNSPETLRVLVDSLIGTMSRDSDQFISVRLSPEDYEMLENHSGRDERANIRFKADPRLERGECRLETEWGILNYSLERELERCLSYLTKS